MFRALSVLLRALVVLLGCFATTAGAADITLTPDEVLSAVAQIPDTTFHVDGPYGTWGGAAGPGGTYRWYKDNVEITVYVKPRVFFQKMVFEYGKIAQNQYPPICTEFEVGWVMCDPKDGGGVPVKAVSPNSFCVIKAITSETVEYTDGNRESGGGWSYGGGRMDPDSALESCRQRVTRGAIANVSYLYGTNATIGGGLYTYDRYNQGVINRLTTTLNKLNPSIPELINEWGVSISVVGTYEAKPWSCEIAVDGRCANPPAPGTGGTGTTPGTGTTTNNTYNTNVECTKADGTKTTSQIECAPQDAELKCSIIDIPCNLRKLFVPSPGFWSGLFGAHNITHQLELPVVVNNFWHIELFGKAADFDWRTIIIPDPVKQMILAALYWRMGFWVMAYLGLPLPFGNPSGGGSVISEGADAVGSRSEFQSLRRRAKASYAKRGKRS